MHAPPKSSITGAQTETGTGDDWRIAIEHAGVGAWHWDTRHGVLHADAIAQRLWGVPMSDQPVALSAVADMLDPQGAAWLQDIGANPLAAGEGMDMQVQVGVAHGPGRWVQWRGQAERNRPWMLHGVCVDVTAQRQAQETLRQRLAHLESELARTSLLQDLAARSEARLREREADLARVQRIGAVGGLDIDIVDGMSSRRSPEYLRLHGLPAQAIHETHEDWRSRLHPDDVEQAEDHLLAVLESDATSYESEYRIIRPNDGEVRWIAARADIERNAQGRPVRLVGAHIDVTEQKRVQDALRRSEERLRQFGEAS